MNTTTHPMVRSYTSKVKAHPLIIAAAVALILFSVVGIGVMTGLIPTANSKSNVAAKTATTAEPSAPVAASKSETVTKKAELAPVCANCGVVQSVRVVEKASEASGLGAIAGGITGAVVGHQVGEGQGKSLATVVAAVGGAVAGNKIEQNMHKTRSINVNVRMEDGATRTVRLDNDPGLLVGDKVKIVDGALVRR
ncbi:MAG: glycine zipper 2TM domain-containing protein [Gammaproteobacteria bacterium]|nr:glycine zipper 2TM domain-containing protein [Gammaproteobacteria bacterium]